MKIEVWRDVIGYEGYYQVSNQGRVRSLDRTVLTKRGERFYKGRIMKNPFNEEGYKNVCLSKNGKQEKYKIHKLVAMTFLNHTPNGHTLVVDHINGVKADNNVDNLRIVTHRDNTSTCYRANEDSFSSDFIGVYRFKDIWRAQIRFNSKVIYLGQFDSEINASNAYQKALSKVNDGTFNPEDYKPNYSSKYKGVTRFRNRWVARPTINGKQVYLGVHTTEDEAHQAILEFEAIQPILI